ncbi:NAD-dependent epimerase/dehydratase family protein [Yinghuangia seranimata]|uniref:NAD-dependent epimerase/dehydratase family protein n=1 Tax=Yinghuangia seranimata TaxID=408067 RepID=UPI00248B8068|nr:NAD-dependent epimerase/dehydratase family protein [Yinghuangia seranimata]MDI2127325.1 NAD-dependent epimerase/dehydratase family protein [Yinghuangia seranimata]
MDILVIGGSLFLGRSIVEEALKRGHKVTTFNRGRTGIDVPGVEAVRGDRENKQDLERLVGGRSWDAVIDVCGFTPRVVGDSVAALNGHARAYTFVSSLSSYQDWPTKRIDESSPRNPCAPDAEEGDGDYGILKAGCERAVEGDFEGRTLIVQPGLILGPYENVGRLPAWLYRMAEGGRVLAPGDPDRAMQLIDSRDLAAFTLDRTEAGAEGRYVVSGSPANTTMGDWLADCVEATGSDAELVWVDDEFLLEHGVEPWSELPLWAPASDDFAGVWLPDPSKALADGLVCRPVRETVRDTWAWLKAAGMPTDLPRYRGHQIQQGINREKERAILAAWDERSA